MPNVWVVRNDRLSEELLTGGFVSLDSDLGDLREIGFDREGLKAALATVYPERKEHTRAIWAGTLLRFGQDIAVGDVIVAPYPTDGTINIAVCTGPYEYDSDAPFHRHRRSVAWKQLGIPRSAFSRPALNEIGSLLTVFAVKRHTAEFLTALERGADPAAIEAAAGPLISSEALDEDEPRASRIDRHTRDFIKDVLKSQLSHREFEEFTAEVLRAIGYQARVTAYTRDGGVDVLAHRDPLGLEPPLIKVQCKHHTGTVGAPDINQLVGTLGSNELGLFVTLGTYSADALAIERVRPALRLLTGEDFVDLVLRNYNELAPKCRLRIPLTSVLVVDDAADL